MYRELARFNKANPNRVKSKHFGVLGAFARKLERYRAEQEAEKAAKAAVEAEQERIKRQRFCCSCGTEVGFRRLYCDGCRTRERRLASFLTGLKNEKTFQRRFGKPDQFDLVRSTLGLAYQSSIPAKPARASAQQDT